MLAVNTGCDANRLVGVGEFDIPKGDILDVAVSGIGLDPCCITTVREMDGIEYHVVNVIGSGRVLPNTSDTHSP
jgi:hypothetical protein